MFNPTQIVIEAFVGELQRMYERTYGVLEPSYPGIIGFFGRLALENIANSDAAYHDVTPIEMSTAIDGADFQLVALPTVIRLRFDAP